MSVLTKVVDAILAGNKIAISNDHDTLTRVLNACCVQLTATVPTDRKYTGYDTEFHPWDDTVSNYIQFAMDTCPTAEAATSALVLAINVDQYNLKIACNNVKSWIEYHTRYGSYILQSVGYVRPEFKQPYAKHWDENQVERERARIANDTPKQNWGMYYINEA